ncbi:unnamed protein product [Plutella xylostella]|uniref:(diamondback moth) hypothetical protein n=1 Tax=Plutella xylostella TaxID=51655 RepID=A0A8S4GAR9_PLUXY|nr:unnamed protein product [Plutella xylostella]
MAMRWSGRRHHAMRAEPCGYCFYNNVALAARHAIDKLGVKRW